jgi:hypothetical protein
MAASSQEQQLVQRIPMPKVRALIDSGDKLLVATTEQVLWLLPVPIEQQVCTSQTSSPSSSVIG